MLKESSATSGPDFTGMIHESRAPASGAVIDAIAEIERKRQETQKLDKKTRFAMARSSALHRLNELLAYETEALRLRGPDSRHRENTQAVAAEIGRVKALSRETGRSDR